MPAKDKAEVHGSGEALEKSAVPRERRTNGTQDNALGESIAEGEELKGRALNLLEGDSHQTRDERIAKPIIDQAQSKQTIYQNEDKQSAELRTGDEPSG